MTISGTPTLSALAEIAQQTYIQPLNPDGSINTGSLNAPVTGATGTYVEITQIINGPLGFQGRAFFNTTENELVIAFTGTEGVADVNAPEFLPDFIAGFSLAVAGASPQDAAAQLFVTQARAAAQAEVGPFGSFDVTYMGHSLGGFLAQTASMSGPEGEVVVFNSPGAGGFLGLPNSDTFPEENYTYIYSDPSAWGVLGGPIHSIGNPLSDNIYYVPGSAGHAISTVGGTGLALGDVLMDDTILVPAGDGIFLPINESLQVLGATQLLDFFDDGGDADSAITGTSGADTLTGTDQNDEISGLAGDDTIFGGAGQDIIFGNGGADELHGGINADTIRGGFGNDTVWGDDGRDIVYLGSGNDVFHDNTQSNSNGADTVYGQSGDDTINGGGGNDVFWGGAGNDTIYGGIGDDEIHGGADDDTIWAGDGNDTVWGNQGRDTIELGDGDDIFHDDNPSGGQDSQLERDTVNGGNGNDTINGGEGDDTFRGNAGNDIISGGDNDDAIYGGNNDDVLDGEGGQDELFGGNGNDLLNGGGGSDDIRGGAGQDDLDGGTGNDILYGGGGNDLLQGGKGNDTLTGGGGADTFVFTGLFNRDVITDFNPGQAGEKIDLAGVAEITDYADLTASHLSQQGTSMVISINPGNTITLEDVSSLSANDFIF